MVKKLLKYEFLSYSRLLIPIEAAVLGVSILARILIFVMENIEPIPGFEILYFLLGEIGTMLVIEVFSASIILITVLAAIRFFKNLFTREGYLSFTLPVTPTEHIFAKISGALIAHAINYFTLLVGIAVILSGDYALDIFEDIGSVLVPFFSDYTANAIMYVVEGLLLLVLLGIASIFTIYLCMSLGQLMKRLKVFASIGFYYAFTVTIQVLFYVCLILSPFILYNIHLTESQMFLAWHLGLIISVIVLAAFNFVCFIVTRAIITKKLNLE